MCRKFGWHILSLFYAFRAFISFLFTSFLLRISVQVSEGILHQQVHAVGMVGGIVEVSTPTTQILRTYLHVWGDIPEQVCYEILSIAVSGRFVGRIPVFGIEA